MNLAQAVNAPRIHHQWLPDRVAHEPFGLSQDTAAALQAKGHALAERPATLGDVQAIMIDPETGARLGVSDPRSVDGRAVGY
jgi:gamma-glutamyltranspeptidase/glutathione hydrolase